MKDPNRLKNKYKSYLKMKDNVMATFSFFPILLALVNAKTTCHYLFLMYLEALYFFNISSFFVTHFLFVQWPSFYIHLLLHHYDAFFELYNI